VSHDGTFKSIPRDESVFDIALERAVALLNEPKSFSARGALKVLGKHPEDGQPVALYAGRYGPYVKHGKVNATLPDENMISTVTLEEALELINAKAGKGKKGKAGSRAPAKAPAKTAAKTASKASEKSAAKAKPAAKKKPAAAAKKAR
jgi:DNA topoisomerase-1